MMEPKTVKTDLGPRLDRLPWSGWHTKAMFALGFAWFLDSLEASIIGSVLGILKKQWVFTPLQGSLTVSVWLVGIMLGAVIFGYLADRYGRKPLFIITLVWYMGWTVAAAFSTGINFFITVRFLAAIGIGGEYAAISSAIAEFLPRMQRGKIDAILMSMWPLGALASAGVVVVALMKLPPDLAWRAGFLLAAVFALFALYIRWALPESPRWLLERRKHEAANKVVTDIEIEVMRRKGLKELPPVEPISVMLKEHNIWQLSKELFTKFPGRLAVGASMNFAQVAIGYGVMAYAALVVYPIAGVPPAKIPTYMMITFFFGFLGGLTSALMVDTIGRKITGFISYFSLPFAAMGLYLAKTPAQALFAVTLCYYCYSWAWITEYVIKSEFFPTRMRAAGIGWATFFGRLGGVIAAPIMTGAYQAGGALWGALSLAILVTPGWLAGLGWALWGVEGRHLALEKFEKE